MMFRQPSGWPYPSAYPSFLNLAGIPLNNQFDGKVEEEEPIGVKQVPGEAVKPVDPVDPAIPVEPAIPVDPAIAIKSACGIGPATMPISRELTSGRVTGGISATPGAWRFLVNLKKSPSSTTFFCTGTLISDTKVLTAAKCLETLFLFDIPNLRAWLGASLANKSDVKLIRGISGIAYHSGYNPVTNANDIAVLTLDYPVTFTNFIFPACLPPASDNPDKYVGQYAMILGWGSASATPQVLQQAKVWIFPNNPCTYDPTIGTYVTANTLCITSVTNNRFTCNEDLGGPVVILPSPGAWTVVGINSFPQGCTYNGIKTRVSAYRAWIDFNMAPLTGPLIGPVG